MELLPHLSKPTWNRGRKKEFWHGKEGSQKNSHYLEPIEVVDRIDHINENEETKQQDKIFWEKFTLIGYIPFL